MFADVSHCFLGNIRRNRCHNVFLERILRHGKPHDRNFVDHLPAVLVADVKTPFADVLHHLFFAGLGLIVPKLFIITQFVVGSLPVDIGQKAL